MVKPNEECEKLLRSVNLDESEIKNLITILEYSDMSQLRMIYSVANIFIKYRKREKKWI